MLLNLQIVIGHLPDTWIAQSRYDDLSDITTIVIDDRRLPEGVTIDQIITHEVGHARAACGHRQRYAASAKAERDRVYNQAQDYILNEMLRPWGYQPGKPTNKILKPSQAIPGTFEREDWSPAEAHLDATGYMVPPDIHAPRDEFLPVMTTDGRKIIARTLLNGKPIPFKKGE